MTDYIPHYCLFDTKEADRLRSQILESLSSNVQKRNWANHSYNLLFPNEVMIAHNLLDIILKEQVCCSFFEFGIHFNPSNNTILLTISSTQVDKDVIVNIIDALI